MSRLRRFLHIERSRAAAPDAPEATAAARRIGGVEAPGRGPAGPARSGAELDRFAPPPPPALELASAGPGERPFTRCMACGMDHHLFVVECAGCGAPLDTEPQRAFNDELWRRRQEEAAREAAAEAARREARGSDGAGGSGTRALGEAIAREVGEAERSRLDAELGPGGALLAAARRLVGRWLGRR